MPSFSVFSLQVLVSAAKDTPLAVVTAKRVWPLGDEKVFPMKAILELGPLAKWMALRVPADDPRSAKVFPVKSKTSSGPHNVMPCPEIPPIVAKELSVKCTLKAPKPHPTVRSIWLSE